MSVIPGQEEWIWKTKQKDLNQARKLSNMLWFIDGLVAIDYVGELDKVHHEI